MLKKTFLLLLFSVNLCGAQAPSTFTSPEIASYMLNTIIPNILKESPELDKETQEKLAVYVERFIIAMGIVIGGYCAVKLGYAGKALWDYTYPSEAKKAALKAAFERTQILKAERTFTDCLMSNAWASRNESGIPTVCENLARAFAAVAGEGACEEMITNFQGAYAR